MPRPEILAKRKEFERKDGKKGRNAAKDIAAIIKTKIGIDIIKDKIPMRIEYHEDNPSKLALLQIDGDLTQAQQNKILAAFPELRKRG